MFNFAVSSLINFKSKNDFILSFFALWSDGKDQNATVYINYRIRSFLLAGRPRLCRNRGRHITELPPSFQCEKCLFGYHKTSPQRFLSQNACRRVLYYRVLVYLALLNGAVCQLLVLFRTFWCSIFAPLLLWLPFERWIIWGSDFKPRFAVPALVRKEELCTCCQQEEEHGLIGKTRIIIRVHDSIR